MGKQHFILIIGILLLNGLLFSADERPNILFIFTDDQSSRTISSYPESYEWTHTPNIDQSDD